MVGDIPDTLSGFIDEVQPSEKTLLVVNNRAPAPLVNLLSRAFEDQSVSVSERQIPEGGDELVCLIDDGDVVAMTPFADLEESFLMVNVDRYRTGTRQSATGSFPDVLTGLSDIEFTVRGFPESTKEKLLLVVISRFIEYRALSRDDGELYATFQRLSRLDDEYGTRTMYQRLGESDVETHVYGVRDDPDVVADLDLTVHSGETEEYRRSWVVLYTPDPDAPPAEEDHVALVAVETESNVWRGTWTYDADRVERIRSYVHRSF